MSTYDPKFYAVDGTISKNFFSNQLESNLKDFLDYGFLSAGGWITVKRTKNNIHGMSQSTLRPIDDPNYNDGQVWQAPRKGWVWETGISVDGNSPHTINGFHVDGAGPYYPNAVGTFAHQVDYQNGRIIFNTKISQHKTVDMDYSYRWVQIYNYAYAGWFRQLQFNSDSNNTHVDNQDKGDYFLDPKNRVQLPAIVIETVPRSSSEPYRLGDKSMRFEQDVLLHVVAENYYDRNNIADAIKLQEDRVIKMYDINTVAKSGVYPYNFNGTLNSGVIQYNNLVNNDDYFFNSCRLKNIVVSDVESITSELYECTIRITAEIIIV